MPIVIWIVGLVDALRRPDADWAATGQNKLTWVLFIALSQLAAVGFLLSIVYWVSARPALKRAAVRTFPPSSAELSSGDR